MKKGNFYSLKSLQKHIRKNGTTDYIQFDNMLFTMDEYDMAGKVITYGNLKHRKVLEVQTYDRYKNGFKDAIIEIYDLVAWRNDINYAE